jgi:hypothetical protein
MADKKISALTGASTPLAGTEVLPIVQSGATVKVAVSDLTAGRAISATAITASTGNLTFSASGKGSAGTTTNDNADAGVVGEYVEATFNSVTVTTAPGNMTSISLTAGDWDVSFRLSSGGAGATCTSFQFGINTVSATLGTQGTDYLQNAADVVNGGAGGSFPVKRISIASTTTVYGVASTAAGTMTFTTGVLYARRVR